MCCVGKDLISKRWGFVSDHIVDYESLVGMQIYLRV